MGTHPASRGRGLAALTFLTLAALPAPATGQLIPVRTIPVSQAHQWDVFPSRWAAMGGASIALGDALGDPFRNPAAGTTTRDPFVFIAPGTYNASLGTGAGWTLPFGVLYREGAWFGGLAHAIQRVKPSERLAAALPGFRTQCSACADELPGERFGERSVNGYLFGVLGRDVPGTGLSVGGSALWTGLAAVDGTDLLYTPGTALEQSGSALDLRLGARKDWAGERTLDAVLLHRRVGLTDEVLFADRYWDPEAQAVALRPRTERSPDETRTWGLHLEYRHPLRGQSWRMGWLGTVNRHLHPGVPEYGFPDVPTDPGRSTALNLGVGVAHEGSRRTFVLDAIYEPVWKRTRAGSSDLVVVEDEEAAPEGAGFREGRFRFSNVLLRGGLREEVSFPLAGDRTVLGFEGGIGVRTVHYDLRQREAGRSPDRRREERWVEWIPTWGVTLGRSAFELRYRGRVTHGSTRPGPSPGSFGCCFVGFAPADPMVAPGWWPPAMEMRRVRIREHRLSLSFPLGWGSVGTGAAGEGP